jgi:hypothetical protein
MTLAEFCAAYTDEHRRELHEALEALWRERTAKLRASGVEKEAAEYAAHLAGVTGRHALQLISAIHGETYKW